MTRRLSWSMRFALAVSSVFAIGALSAGGISYVLQTRELSARLAEDVRATAEGLAHIADGGDRQDLEEQVRALVVSSNDGSTLVGWIDAGTGSLTGNLHALVPFEGARDLTPGRDLDVSGLDLADAPESYAAYAIQTPLGMVIAASDKEWVAESGEILVHNTIAGLGAALLLSIGLAVLIARRNERRIRSMEGLLDEVGAGHHDLRIRDVSDDDLARLAGKVDTTLDRLEDGIEAIRQVSTDVAHDLRAPLTRLRIKIEPFATDASLPAAARHAFGSTLSDIDGIGATFDAILRLARLQSGSVELHPEPVDLGELAREVHELLEPVAEEDGKALEVSAPMVGPIVTGDRELLTQALVNLAENALRHCPSPARIVIGAGQGEGGGPTLWVEDDGPGIPAQDRARVLDRFVRLDRSRTASGTGLGLSLVAAIAARHDAQLALQDNTPGLLVRIVFSKSAQIRA